MSKKKKRDQYFTAIVKSQEEVKEEITKITEIKMNKVKVKDLVI